MWVKTPIRATNQLRTNLSKGDIGEAIKNKIVVNPKVAEAITDIGIGAKNTIENGGFLRNVLQYVQE